MERYTQVPDARTSIAGPAEHYDGCERPQSRLAGCQGTDKRATEISVVAARFTMYEMAQEALDEGRLWFSDEDFVCLRNVAVAPVDPSDMPTERSVYLMTRVRDQAEASRAIEIMRGRGATRVDILPLSAKLHGSACPPQALRNPQYWDAVRCLRQQCDQNDDGNRNAQQP